MLKDLIVLLNVFEERKEMIKKSIVSPSSNNYHKVFFQQKLFKVFNRQNKKNIGESPGKSTKCSNCETAKSFRLTSEKN